MLKDFYNAIISRLESLVTDVEIQNPDTSEGQPETITVQQPVIKQTGWWNEQWAYEAQNPALSFPCVFVEIAAISWQQLGQKVQQADATIRLHIGSRTLNDNDVNHLDLIESINYIMSGFNGTNFGSFTRTSLEVDHNHDALVANVMTYRSRIEDRTAMRPMVKKTGDLFVLEISRGTISIGDYLQGGHVFYIDETGKHGKVVHIERIGQKPWAPELTIIGADSESGSTNTDLILDAYPEADTAALMAANFNRDGYDDWYLPSLFEINQVYDALKAGGTLEALGYLAFWTSTEDSENNALFFTFQNGTHYPGEKTIIKGICVIRDF